MQVRGGREEEQKREEESIRGNLEFSVVKDTWECHVRKQLPHHSKTGAGGWVVIYTVSLVH